MNLKKIAQIVSVILGPILWLVLLVLLIFKSESSLDRLIILSMLFLVFFVLVPFGYIYYAYKHKKIKDLDLSNRKQRLIPLILTNISLLIGSVFINYVGNQSTKDIIFLFLILLLINTVITVLWKISLHMALNIVFVLLVNAYYQWRMWYLWMFIVLIFWSRLYLKKHTLSQITVSLLLNGAVVLLFLRMKYLI